MTAPGRLSAGGAPSGGSTRLGGSPLGGAPLGVALPTRQRHHGFIALAIALIVGLAAIGAYLYSSAGAKVPVVMVVRQVPVGQVIEREDLTTVPVSGQVTALGGGNLSSAVGQRAAVTLLPNTLLQRAMFTSGQTLAAGQAQVGVAVRSGQIPSDGLIPGDAVRVVQLPVKGSPDLTAKVLAERAQVFSTRADPAASGGTLVTVVVPQDASTAIAAASGAELIALVKVAS